MPSGSTNTPVPYEALSLGTVLRVCRLIRLALIGVMALLFTSTAAQATPPNVVLIISDDQAWSDFGFMGHPVVRTPHLDRLAESSAVFPRGYVPTSLCRPSLATLITGLYPHQHKITGNDPPRGTDRAAMLKHIRNVPTLPRLLAEQGYLSHQSGKWWEGHFRLGGFTAGMTHGNPQRGGRHGDEGLKIGRQGLQPIFSFIEGCGESPYFLWYAPFLPHSPHNPPQRLLANYAEPGRPPELARYFAMCEWFDETCGQLLDFLEERGDADNTLVVFVTDNGWIQRTPMTETPEGWRHQFAPKSKRSPYDGGVRTPIMLRWPGKLQAGRYDTLVHSIDLAPTILAAAGIDLPSSMPGIDLRDVIAAGGRTGRQAIFGEIFDHDVVDIDDPARGLQYRWCIDGRLKGGLSRKRASTIAAASRANPAAAGRNGHSGRWKLIIPAGRDESVELYDLTADPHETSNLADEHADRVRELTALTNAWWNSGGGTAAGNR